MVELLIGRQLHKVIVKRYEQFLANEHLQVLWFGFYLIMFKLAGPREDLDLLIQNNIADVELAHLAYFDKHHHDL